MSTSLALRILKTLISGILDDLNSMFMVKYAVIEIPLFITHYFIVQFAWSIDHVHDHTRNMFHQFSGLQLYCILCIRCSSYILPNTCVNSRWLIYMVFVFIKNPVFATGQEWMNKFKSPNIIVLHCGSKLLGETRKNGLGVAKKIPL